MPKVTHFEVRNLCPGTDPKGPRAKVAKSRPDLFPFIANVYNKAASEKYYGKDRSKCKKCGSTRLKLTVESQVDIEARFGFATRESRCVCESMGKIVGDRGEWAEAMREVGEVGAARRKTNSSVVSSTTK